MGKTSIMHSSAVGNQYKEYSQGFFTDMDENCAARTDSGWVTALKSSIHVWFSVQGEVLLSCQVTA